jgi:hypothetical protein
LKTRSPLDQRFAATTVSALSHGYVDRVSAFMSGG